MTDVDSQSGPGGDPVCGGVVFLSTGSKPQMEARRSVDTSNRRPAPCPAIGQRLSAADKDFL